jgi:predicted XRE-type DNA-binding protein
LSKDSIPAFNCKDCDKYTSCKSLCAAAKRYVNQGYKRKGKKEILSGVAGYNPQNKKLVPKSKEEIIVKLFFKDHLKVTQIAEMLEIKHPHVSRTIKKYQTIIIENLKKQGTKCHIGREI